MLKKTIKYTDYEGVEREEDFYFNLNKAEVMEMQLSTDGTLTKLIQKIIADIGIPADADALIAELYDRIDGLRFASFALSEGLCLPDIGDLLPAVAPADTEQIVIYEALVLVIINADIPCHHQRNGHQNRCADDDAGEIDGEGLVDS